MRIAIIEDEALVAMEIEMHLEDAGHEVVGVADNLGDAIDLADRTQPDFALVDINLGAGSSGFDVAKALAARNIICLFATGNCPGDHREDAVGCLHKPYNGQQLLSAVIAATAVANGEEPGSVPSVMHLFR